MLVAILSIVAGFALLLAGGEFFVRGAVGISKKLGFSPLLIGLTVVAFATSAPELFVSISSALKGSVDLSVGNVVGSNIANILLILGVSALITPIVLKGVDAKRDLMVMCGSALALLLAAFTGGIARWMGVVLFLFLVAYVWFSYAQEKKEMALADSLDASAGEAAEEVRAKVASIESSDEVESAPKSLWLSFILVVVGLAALLFGSEFLISGATKIAEAWGVSEAVIGLTIVAIGTSLPELAASVVSALRGHSDMAIGNVVGSNIFNILSILGLTAIVKPIAIAPTMLHFNIPFMLIISLVLLVVLLGRKKISRPLGFIFLATYVCYVVYLYVGITAA